jgi:hypothetical protein
LLIALLYFVRWVFKQRDDISLSRALLSSAAPGELPAYLSESFAAMFIDADSNGDGKISTIELMHVLKRRAKGTKLNGNSHAIFTLKKLLEDQADHGDIGVKEWSTGLHAAIVGDPNGAVALWILKELQDEAAGLSAHTHASRHKDPSIVPATTSHTRDGALRAAARWVGRGRGARGGPCVILKALLVPVYSYV